MNKATNVCQHRSYFLTCSLESCARDFYTLVFVDEKAQSIDIILLLE